MADKMWDDIVAFHNKFKLPQSELPSVALPDGLMEFRVKFLREELNEFVEAVDSNDTVKAFDALLDLVYVAMGTAYICRMPWVSGWEVVQAANMTKIRVAHAAESKRGSSYDVVKPVGWVAPDHELQCIIEIIEQRLKRSKLVIVP